MEAVLYDIYIAEGEINNNYSIFSSDSARKQDLLNSVFKKHKIKEADFDSSLVWYSGHLDKYIKINEKLNLRFAALSDTIRKREMQSKPAVLDANLIYMPVKEENFFLTSSNLFQNAYTFKADTLLNRYGGTYKLQFNVLGITPLLRPVVTFCVKCTDTTFVDRTVIEANGVFESALDVLPMKQATELYGSVYFPVIYSSTNVFISNFVIAQGASSNPKKPSKEMIQLEKVK